MASRPSEDDLQDLIDGRLPERRLVEVHAWLAREPSLAVKARDLRANDLLLQRYGREMLSRLAAEGQGPAVPARSRSGAGARADGATANTDAPPPGTGRAPARAAGLAAAGALALTVGLSAGWWARMSYDDPQERMVNRLVAEATSAYTHATSNLVDFPPEEQDAFNAWSTEAFGVPIEPPDLSEAGYSYAGARIFPSAERAASLLAYRRDGETISVYCWRGSPLRADLPRHLVGDDVQVRFKTAGGFGFAVVGPRGSADFDRTADTVFEGLSHLGSDMSSADSGTASRG